MTVGSGHKSNAAVPRTRRHMMQLAIALSFIWVGAAHMLEIAPHHWLLGVADKITPIRQLFVSELIELRALQGTDPHVYVIYCYFVLPIYLACLLLVSGAYRLPALAKVPEGSVGPIELYRRRVLVFAVACLIMMVTSLYLPSYFVTQDLTHHVTVLAIFDVIETWCQGIFLGGFISSIKEYRNEQVGGQVDLNGYHK